MARATAVLAGGLSLLAVFSALDEAYLGTVGALVALTALLTVRVLGARAELRRWASVPAARPEARTGPFEAAVVEVREAAAGSYYFRQRVAEALERAAGSKLSLSGAGAAEVSAPTPSPRSRGERYLSELGVAMDLIEDAGE